ncbi:restriction endonuclease subunit S [Marinifilum fragile]|uniref:restriction endonuclease subunit S n=1 Tax=Marinifilum fragile TaxID=570161 RepID=UPI002AA91993|nr:restriction endonuclease subunit S [Marinifilum fragile]
MVEEFNNTDIGLIPEDWEFDSIGNKIDLLTGFPFPSNKYVDNGIKLLRGSNVKRGVTDWSEENTKFWSEITFDLKKYILEEGDIVIAMDGSLVGKSFARLSKSDVPALLLQRVARIRSEEIDMGYLKEFVCSTYFTKHCDNVKTASAIPHISPKDINSFEIPLPPTKAEQTAIATSLNDADKLISSLEKLIAKKRAIKQGAIQKLLKPKDGWEEKDFPDVCWFQEGPGLRKWQFTNSGIKVINVTNLENGFLNLERTDRYISIEEFNRMYRHFEIDEKDIVVASSGNSYGKVAIVRKQDLPLLMNTSVIRFKPLKNLDYNYLLVFLKSHLFKDQIDLMITGGAQPNFGPAHLKKIKISLPKTKAEQSEISGIITDMDNEIYELEKKLIKYKMLKQGMMQSLLTGKIRLV